MYMYTIFKKNIFTLKLSWLEYSRLCPFFIDEHFSARGLLLQKNIPVSVFEHSSILCYKDVVLFQRNGTGAP